MKTSALFPMFLLGAGMACAQAPATDTGSLEADILKQAKERLTLKPTVTINQIVSGNFVYSGIVVQLIRADNPLQLINPVAPVRYGYAEQNLVRDLITGRPSGLRLFSWSF